MVENIAWCLPRPRRKDKYPGGFPQHFEKKLLDLLEGRPHGAGVLHPFGGRAEYGIRVDLNYSVKPDIIADAHLLPFRDSVFDIVICDPPYSSQESKAIYNTPRLYYRRWVAEAVRVLRPGGYLVQYHRLALPSAPSTKLVKRILIEIHTWHRPRVCKVYQKDGVL